MEKSSFFNSINGDRRYKAEEFAAYFASFISNGIFPNPSTNLQVLSNNDMTVTIKKGKAWINGYFYENTDDLILGIDNADGVLNRIDRVVVRLDKVTREVKTIVKKGTFASSPIVPELTRNADIYELGIAEIKVNKGTVSIVQSNITDTRFRLDVCGVTNSLITVDVELITNQFSQDFNNWFDMIKDQLGEDAAGNLQNQIGNINDPTLPAELKGMALTEQTKYVLENAGKVKSVNSKTGDVVIDIEDISGLNNQSVKIGLNATNVGQGSVAIGREASAAQTAVAIGYQPKAEKMNSIAIGFRPKAYELDSIAIGILASANESEAISIGKSTEAGVSAIAIGARVKATNSHAISLGTESNSEGSYGVALGMGTKATGSMSITLGMLAEATGTMGVAIGAGASALNNKEGILGASAQNMAWKVPGSFSVTGTKNFEISHPHPDKKATHVIRHGAVESPTAGDTLYRYTIIATEDNQTVEMQLPDYFQYLNKNVDVWVNGYKHFGRAFGEVEGDTLKVTCELAGEYKVLVIGTRNDDHQSVQDWDIKGVEREIGESWTGETYVFEVDEIIEVEEIKEVA